MACVAIAVVIPAMLMMNVIIARTDLTESGKMCFCI